jgi:hypothetical protein
MPRHVVSRGWHPEILLKPMDFGLRRNDEKQVTDLFRDSLVFDLTKRHSGQREIIANIGVLPS